MAVPAKDRRPGTSYPGTSYPGASYPGSSDFGAYGGLTCYLATENSRTALFESMRNRHHHATTGCRMHLDVSADGADGPVMMGDVVSAKGGSMPVRISAHAATGIETIELRNGAEVIETIRTHDEASLGGRIRVVWSGAEYRGRGRDTLWQGVIDIAGASIRQMTPINRWNPERLLEQRGRSQAAFESVTTGNFAGVDLWLDSDDAELTIRTNPGEMVVRVADLAIEAVTLQCGGLERRLTVIRLPDTLAPSMSFERDVTTEDGHQARSSPIYVAG